MYEIVPEEGGRRYAIYWRDAERVSFICRYLKRENAQKHIDRLKEKWG